MWTLRSRHRCPHRYIQIHPLSNPPTGKNIRLALSEMFESAKPGDSLFVHFSGHGYRFRSENPDDDTGYDEFILPTDFNPITDDDFKAYIASTPGGCTVTISADACHSGGLIEGAKEHIGDSSKIQSQVSRSALHNMPPIEPNAEIYYVKSRALRPSALVNIFNEKSGRDDIHEANLKSAIVDIFGEDASPTFKKPLFGTLHAGCESKSGGPDMQETGAGSTECSPQGCGILLSACQSYEGAAEGSFPGNPAQICGAFTNSVVATIGETRGVVTNRRLVLEARKKLKEQGFTQKPGLYCCDCHAGHNFMRFSGLDVLANMVAELGWRD